MSGLGALAAGGFGLALSLVATSAAHAGQPPTPFYLATPAELAAGSPGSIIRSEQFGGSVWGATSYRVLYRSTGLNGEPIAVSGVIVVPGRPAPRGGFPVVAWAHPTTGIARDCAPSLRQTAMLGTIAGLEEIIEFGFVIAATDYPGLGTTGTHPYLVGISEARAVLDSVRAARALAGASERFAVWGHSQGGHAALWTGQLTPLYAPELKLAGIAAAAPATILGDLFENDLTSLAGQTLTSLTVDSWSSIYQTAIETMVLSDSLQYVIDIGKNCITKVRDLLKDKQALDGLGRKFLKGNPVTLPPWSSYVAANTPGKMPIVAPIFISQGLADTVVDPPVTVAFAKQLCGQGTPVAYLQRVGITHADIARKTAPQAVSWIADRMAGRPPPSNCIK